MRDLGKNMKFILLVGALFTISPSYAVSPSHAISSSHAVEKIEVVAAEGSVMAEDAAGKTTKTVQTKGVLATGNILSTGPDARAVVKVGSSGYIVLGKNSQIEINKSDSKPGFFRQIKGVVFYALNSLKRSQRSMEVRTATTTIGIRGTRFIVTDDAERNEIGMRKGLISVSSVDGEFEIHKKSQQDEFEAFKQEGDLAIDKEKREFAEYNAKTQKEFIEYKREFSLEANRMASFDGKRVVDLPLSGETKKDMETLEGYADEWLKEVRD